MSARADTISIASGGCPAVPTIMPPSRVRSTTAPAAALRSMISCTRAACAAGYPTTRPTMPFDPITAMLGRTPSAVPLSIVISRMPGVAFGFPPDYQALHGRLLLQGAVEIQPFRAEQVSAFLSRISPQLRGVADALAADEQLWEMLTTPLMLNIMALAYGDGSAPDVPAEGDPETRRRLLFDAYVVEVLARYRARTWGASTARTLQALSTLARFTTAVDSGVQVVRPTDATTVTRGFDSAQKEILAGWLMASAGTAAAVPAAAVVASRTGIAPGLSSGRGLDRGLPLPGLRTLVPVHNRVTAARGLLLLAWSVLVAAAYLPAAANAVGAASSLFPADSSGWSRWLMAGLTGFTATSLWA